MIDQIKELRKVIRYHRDQIGDDRCWVDDYKVWNTLPDTKQVLRLPTNAEGLRSELGKLESAIRKHSYIVYRERTLEDDKELYSVLPEKIPADFRLPCEEDFLGTVRTDAGCPQFWNSHQNCPGEHDLHQWGPCRKS